MQRSKFLKFLGILPLSIPIITMPKPMAAKEEVTIFTPEMLRKHNFGLYIINSKVKDVTKRPNYAATVSWKLGYINHPLENNDNKYGKSNFLTDGWFCPLTKTADELCNWLNNNPYGEKYRLMTKQEVTWLLNNRKQGFL